MASSMSTMETTGNGIGASGSCSPNEGDRAAAAVGGDDSLPGPRAAGRPGSGAPFVAPPRGGARRADQRPLEAGARAGWREGAALRLALFDARLGLLRCPADSGSGTAR